MCWLILIVNLTRLREFWRGVWIVRARNPHQWLSSSLSSWLKGLLRGETYLEEVGRWGVILGTTSGPWIHPLWHSFTVLCFWASVKWLALPPPLLARCSCFGTSWLWTESSESASQTKLFLHEVVGIRYFFPAMRKLINAGDVFSNPLFRSGQGEWWQRNRLPEDRAKNNV